LTRLALPSSQWKCSEESAAISPRFLRFVPPYLATSQRTRPNSFELHVPEKWRSSIALSPYDPIVLALALTCR